jgi:hypothetical protein
METNLSVGDYFLIVVPLSVAVFGWVFAVLWASTHPEVRHLGHPTGRSIAGGMFRGGGREVMPRRDAEPAESVAAAGAAEENVEGQERGRERTVPRQAGPWPAVPRQAGPRQAEPQGAGVAGAGAGQAGSRQEQQQGTEAGQPGDRGRRP